MVFRKFIKHTFQFLNEIAGSWRKLPSQTASMLVSRGVQPIREFALQLSVGFLHM
jgi:hypothetical protein